jgi:SAM-dependent methyltransferase
MTELWADRGFLRDVQYRTDGNLAARQSIYAYQHPPIDLPARVLDLAAPAAGETVADVGCGNGAYLAELTRRGVAGRVIGADLSAGMLAAARGRAGSAALIAGDASALPLRDGAADLTLAMHMLYHVPDPVVAVRELRRVTRAGGRVVVGLNGADHMRELRAIIAAARGADLPKPGERLRLDDGEALLRTVFSSVTRHDFAGELRIPDPEPVADYVRSLSQTLDHGDPDRLVADVMAAAFPSGPGRELRVTTHSGCLICA